MSITINPPFDAVEHPALNLDGDTVVVDTFDRREDLDVQVKLTMKGQWHRKMIGGLKTACGRPLCGYATRDEQYGPTLAEMCQDGCFHPAELAEIPSSPNQPDKPTSR